MIEPGIPVPHFKSSFGRLPDFPLTFEPLARRFKNRSIPKLDVQKNGSTRNGSDGGKTKRNLILFKFDCALLSFQHQLRSESHCPSVPILLTNDAIQCSNTLCACASVLLSEIYKRSCSCYWPMEMFIICEVTIFW